MRPERVRRALLSFTGLFAFVIATALPSPATAADAAAEPHPFTVHDLLAMQRISDPQVSPDGTRVLVHPAHHRPRGQRRPQRPLAGRHRRQRAAPDHDPQVGRFQRPLVAGRALDLLPLDALRLVAGLPAGARRRRGGAGDRPAGRRLEPRALARRQAPRLQPRGLPGLRRRSRLHEEAARRERSAQGLGQDLRQPVHPPLGHLGRRPAQPPVRDAHGGRRAQSI